MISVSLPWNSFKSKSNIKYVEAQGNYYLYATDESTEWSCILPVGEAEEFEQSYKSDATNIG